MILYFPCFSFNNLYNYKLFSLQGDGISPLVQTSVLGKGVKHRPPPIKMPSGSGSSSSGTFDRHEKYVLKQYICEKRRTRHFLRLLQSFGNSVNSLMKRVMILENYASWKKKWQPKLSELWIVSNNISWLTQPISNTVTCCINKNLIRIFFSLHVFITCTDRFEDLVYTHIPFYLKCFHN